MSPRSGQRSAFHRRQKINLVHFRSQLGPNTLDGKTDLFRLGPIPLFACDQNNTASAFAICLFGS